MKTIDCTDSYTLPSLEDFTREAFVREIVYEGVINAHKAYDVLEKSQEVLSGTIDVRFNTSTNQLTFIDRALGLTADEMARVLPDFTTASKGHPFPNGIRDGLFISAKNGGEAAIKSIKNNRFYRADFKSDTAHTITINTIHANMDAFRYVHGIPALSNGTVTALNLPHPLPFKTLNALREALLEDRRIKALTQNPHRVITLALDNEEVTL